MPSIIYLTFVAGLALIVVAVLGGGLEIKEVKIPVLPTVPRALSFTVGCILLALCLLDPDLFKQPADDSNPPHVDLNQAHAPLYSPERTAEKRTSDSSPQSVVIIFAANATLRSRCKNISSAKVTRQVPYTAIFPNSRTITGKNLERFGSFTRTSVRTLSRS
jgi:hypothetical protein